jgi:hypothetical protein
MGITKKTMSEELEYRFTKISTFKKIRHGKKYK